MNFKKITSVLLMIIISTVLFSAVVFSADVPATIDDVKVNGDSLSPSDLNRLSVERGEELEIKVILTANSALENVQIEAEISGYEYNHINSVSDKSRTFDMDANSTSRKYLNIVLPDNVEEDSYKLRITVSNRDDNAVIESYNLKIDALRHSMAIRDIILTPASEVVAGKSMLAAVRVKNMGDRDEDSVKVTISIPDLGLSASDYIDEIEEGDSETSEELYLRIPTCAEPDVYELVAKVTYDDGHEDVKETALVNVVESGVCAEHDEDMTEIEDEEEIEDDIDSLLNDVLDTVDNEEDNGKDTLRTALEIGLIALIILLVIVGLIVGFMKLSEEKDF